jgi:hypothetical protein
MKHSLSSGRVCKLCGKFGLSHCNVEIEDNCAEQLGINSTHEWGIDRGLWRCGRCGIFGYATKEGPAYCPDTCQMTMMKRALR